VKKNGPRSVWLATSALASVMVVSAAQAADMPLKAPVPRVVSDWTGFYIGVHGGYGWARPSIGDLDLNQFVHSVTGTSEADALSFHAPKLRGAVFGGHAGYNWQWGQRGVVGLEMDYSTANIKSTQGASVDLTDCCGHVDTHTLQSKLDSLASARARVGFLVGPQFLLYGTGGAAWGHTKFIGTFVDNVRDDSSFTDSIIVSRSSANHFGWVAGAGTEWKLWDSGMTLRVEYLHYDFGSASLPFDKTSTIGSTSAKGSSFNVPVGRLTTDVVRGGVSYKFGAAQAADMPLKAPVPSVVSDWTGFYIGVHGGYGWARPNISDFDLNHSNPTVLSFGLSNEPFALNAPKLRGAVFGGHAGYNWQWAQRGLAGLEIDYSAADIKSKQEAIRVLDGCCGINTRTLTSKLDSLASARARAGFLVGSEFLLYGTGGAAWGHTKFTDTLVHDFQDDRADFIVAGRASVNHFGWVAGAGTEWKLWGTGMMLRVEYLHYGFGSAPLGFDRNVNNDNKSSSFNVPLDRLTTDVVRGGVSYKF
jgi:outer membrane immunogenic protein